MTGWRCAWWLCAVLSLYGCAGQQPVSSPQTGTGKEWVTDSDEPEVRKRARIRLELAQGYFEQGQLTTALDEIKQSLTADPSYAAAYNMRGLIYMQLNEPKVAEDSFTHALRLQPADGDTLQNLGWFYCQQGRYKESSQMFDRALQTPNYRSAPRTLLTQGICLSRAGQPREAEAALKRSFELDASNPITMYNLAQLLYQRGDNERARFYLRRLNNSERANAQSLWLGIKVENRLQSREAARQLGEQLSRRFPESREAGALDRGAFDE
ncbi:MAG TPA: type IV pilus biogenesis/stability protein PilW [Macromonas sp.]|nr:type IV pilus biogenesis/stability protein PilW [Macromonas sp.]